MFAISSAIRPVQELLGVRYAASAATNPEGTIKLHLNNVREQSGKRDEERKEKGERSWGERRDPSLHRYRKRLGQNGVRRLRRGGREDVIALTTTVEKAGRFE